MKNTLIQLIVVIGGLCSLVLYTQYAKSNDKKDFIQELIRTEHLGKVDSIFLDTDSRMQPIAILDDGSRVHIKNDIYATVQPGDTLYKKADKLEYFLIKNGDSIIYYQKFEGEEIRHE